MDEKGNLNPDSFTVPSQANIDSFDPMFFGVSCAFFALKLLPEPETPDENYLETKNRISAHLLGLLMWKIKRESREIVKESELLKKLENARKHIEELKKTRSEDGKANEKVVRIFASREQCWFSERRNLEQQIDALTNELRVMETSNETSISELNEKLKEIEQVSRLKDKSIEEAEQRRREIEENLKKAESLVRELRENLNRSTRLHSNEILKHEMAFVELVSDQSRLEAEIGRALRQFESAKKELDSALDEKYQSVLTSQRLSMELVKMRKYSEQKDQILSAVLRKSKLDNVEKEMLMKEVKSCRVTRKQAEIETGRWKEVPGTKPERRSLRKMLSRRVNLKSDAYSCGKGAKREENGKGFEVLSLASDPYLTDESRRKHQVTLADVDHSKTDTYKTETEQRRNLEIDAFSEQLRLKDEKLEAFHRSLLSTEIESKRLKSHVENLDRVVTNLRHDNLKLEALLADRESELHSLKKQLVLQLSPPNLQKLHFSPSSNETVWSKVKVVRRKPGQEDRQAMDDAIAEENSREVEKIASPKNRTRQESIDSEDLANVRKSNSTSKMDIRALGVSYKIKRLKQQFVMLERLSGKQESSENENGSFGIRGFYALITLMNKQVDRYQSLQGKADDLCQRMQENNLNLNCGGSAVAKTEDETKRLEHFLEETFQLQRYLVATGQKLTGVQAKIASGFVNDVDDIENPGSFDRKRFADSIKTLFQEVQRGLEIRISRIIGDLGGTLACDGIIHFKKC